MSKHVFDERCNGRQRERVVIRGLAGVIPHHLIEVGHFYLAPGGEEGPQLFQCVQTDEPFEGRFRRKALFMTADGNSADQLPRSSDYRALALNSCCHSTR